MSNPCPICKAAVEKGRPQNPFAPFCSGRCKTIDLGRWLDGAYAVPVTDEAPGEMDLALARAPRGDA